MGKLIVDSIAAEDFLSYHGAQEIRLGGHGPMAVIGSNGAGKSTLVSKALAWGLYGVCSPERMGAATRSLRGKDVIRRKLEPLHEATPDAKQARVEVWLSDGATQYQIVRTRKRSGSDSIQVRVIHEGHDEIDGTDQGYIDRLIGADHEVFVRTCLRGQNDPWNFAEATDAKKRSILDVISGANTLAIPYEKAKKSQQSAKHEVVMAAQRAEDAERRATEVDPSSLIAKANAWDDDKGTRLEAAEQELATLVSHSAGSADTPGPTPTVDWKPYDDAIAGARDVLTKSTVHRNTADHDKTKAAALLAKGKCPTCHQAFPDGSHAHQQAAIDLKPMEEAVADAHTRLMECEKAKREAEAWLRNETEAWQKKLAAANAAKGAAAAADQAKKRVEEIEKAANPWSTAADNARLQHYDLQREAALYREQEREANRRLRLAGAWVNVLSPKGVRAHLAEGALAAIEAESNKWLTVLSGGRFSVAFPATKETKKGAVNEEIQTVIRKGANELPFLNFSGGEKARINLAVDLGVAATFARGGALALSLLVLDEMVFSGLDDDGKAGVVTALHHAGVADIVVIDFDPRLSGVLPRTVMVDLGPDGYSQVHGGTA